MAGPLDPTDATRPQLPDDAGQLTGTLRAIKGMLNDLDGRLSAIETKVNGNIGQMTGLIFPCGSNSATPPEGFLFCHGQQVSRTDYAELFAVIGVTWGVGDGTTTFTLPDLRGRHFRGAPGSTGRVPEFPGIGKYLNDAFQRWDGETDIRSGSSSSLPVPPATGVFYTTLITRPRGSFDPDFGRTDYKLHIDPSKQARVADETRVKAGFGNFVIKT